MSTLHRRKEGEQHSENFLTDVRLNLNAEDTGLYHITAISFRGIYLYGSVEGQKYSIIAGLRRPPYILQELVVVHDDEAGQWKQTRDERIEVDFLRFPETQTPAASPLVR